MHISKKLSKALALVIMLALVIGILPMGVAATVSYSSVTVNGLTMQFGDPTATEYVSPEQDITLTAGSNNTVIVTYSGIANYYPDTLAFYVTNNASTISAISTNGGVTAQPTELVNGVFQPTSNVKAGFYILTVNTANNTNNNVTRTLTITKTDNTTVTLQFTIPPVVAPASNTGVMAYLPAPGQFTNEGVTTGGWGDAFNSGGALKALKNSYSATGISLGAFGGYAVFDFGSPAKNASGAVTSGIYNDDTNEYGVDFIVYGNSYGNNAEPGCIQVGVDNNNNGGITWYDIAGSNYYKSDTVWDYQVVYTNPYMTDDALTPAANNLGQQGYSVSYAYSYTTIGGVTGSTVTGTGTVSYNSFHKHSYFPLNCNYFVARNGQSAALARVSDLSFVDYTPYNSGTSTAATLTLRGVRLGNMTLSGSPIDDDLFLFGYADCHPNGTASAAQVNPYTAGRTTGGDPIDISWAVDSNGNPVDLPAIRYVRVYTGHQLMNGFYGEVSTEVTGVYRATGTGTGSAAAPTITIGGYTLAQLSSMGISVTTTTVSSNQHIISVAGASGLFSTTSVVASGGSAIFMNGEGISTKTITLGSGTKTIQIINQSGTAESFITLLKIS
jgi:hypothetical protein